MRNKFFFFGDYQRTIDNLGLRRARDDPDDGDAQRRFQRRRQAASTTRRRARSTAPAARRLRTTRSRRTGSARSRASLIAIIPEPNIAGAPLGQNNYQKAQIAREDDRRVRHQGQLLAERDQPAVVPPQLPAPGGVRSGSVRRISAARPTAGSPAPARTPASARRRTGRASSAPRWSWTCAAA